MKKTFAVLLAILFIFSSVYISTFAIGENRTKTSTGVVAESESKKNDDKTSESIPEENKISETENNIIDFGPEIVAEAAFLINPSTGTILFEKNADAKMYPASTTKILTAYIALSKLDLNAPLTASATAVDIDKDGSNMGLITGEILSARQLIDSLIIHSANDAANVLAEAVSGSVSDFVNLMNQTAAEIGMKNTHFENPHGYHHDNHYTTARDMAILASKAMENELFAEMVGMRKLTIDPTNKYKEPRVFSTRNAMINPYSDLSVRYRFATGIKTGHTSNAGYCFVGSAVRNNMDLISVVFKSTSYDRCFVDTKNLFEYAYSKYRIRTVNKGDEIASTCKVRWAFGKEHLVLKTNSDVKTVLPRDDFSEELLKSEIIMNKKITAPIKKGDNLGVIKYYYDGEQVAESGLFASRDVSRNIFKQLLSYLLNVWFLSALGIVVIVIILSKINESRKRHYALEDREKGI